MASVDAPTRTSATQPTAAQNPARPAPTNPAYVNAKGERTGAWMQPVNTNRFISVVDDAARSGQIRGGTVSALERQIDDFRTKNKAAPTGNDLLQIAKRAGPDAAELVDLLTRFLAGGRTAF